MSYPVSENAPKVTIAGRVFSVGAFQWANPVGNFYKIGVYEKQQDGSFNESISIGMYANTGEFLADVKSKGGAVKFLEYVIAKVNAFFAQLLGTVKPVPVTTEPTTDDEALSYMVTHLAAMTFSVVNGVPVLA